MLGMHGTVVANYAVDQADLLVALGVRFDDRVTGRLDAFAARARIVHVGGYQSYESYSCSPKLNLVFYMKCS